MEELNHKQVILKGCHLREGEKNGVGWVIMEIFTDQESYSLWLKKKDGTETKAFTQLKAMGFPVNKRVGVAYDIKDGSYVNQHTGKKVEKQDRTIVFFEDKQAEHEVGKPEIQEEAEMPEDLPNHDEINTDEIPF